MLLRYVASSFKESYGYSFFAISYIEHDRQDAFVKPWVWIITIIAGPLYTNVAFQLYIYLSVRLPLIARNVV